MTPQKEDNSIKKLLKNIVRTLKMFLEINPKIFVLTCITIVVISCLPFISSYLYGKLINNVVLYLGGETGLKSDIFRYFFIALGANIVLAFAWRTSSLLERFSWFAWHEKLTYKVTDKLSRLDIEIYEDPKFNTLLQKVKDGYDHRPQQFAERTVWLLNDLIQIVLATTILFSLAFWILPVILISLIPEFLVTLRGSKLAWGIWDAKGEVNKLYWEAKSNLTSEPEIKEVRILGARSYLLDFAAKLKSDFLGSQRAILKKESFGSFFAKFLEHIVGAGVEFWLLLRILQNDAGFGIGNYNFYLSTITKFSDASRNLLRNIGKMYEDNLYMTDLYKLLDLENKIEIKENGEIIPTKTVPHIEFRNVSFKYPGTDKYVFDNFSMVINPGDDIAIVGENGAGKTTFVKLLCRFYDVNEGEILINGKNIKDIDLDSWYRNIGVLFQDFNRYAFSARQNIYLGDTSQKDDMKAIKNAAKDAGADKIITKLPKRYKQILSKWFQEGMDLSGGQWQRIALARAFFRNSNILILDEPTSAIDAVGEYEIFKRIAEVQEEKTTIIISHRFSTVKKAHKIYVIEHGKIIESGTHTELMSINDGEYKKMFELQAEGYR